MAKMATEPLVPPSYVCHVLNAMTAFAMVMTVIMIPKN